MTKGATSNLLGRWFTNEFDVAVDKQRRVAIPKAWRGATAEENHFFLLPGRGGSIQLVEAATFHEMLAKLRKVSIADPNAARAMAVIGAMMHDCTCDKQGRISLTPKLMEHAKLNDRAKLVGALTHVQVWAPEQWERDTAMDTEGGLDILQQIQEKPDDLSAVLRGVVTDAGA